MCHHHDLAVDPAPRRALLEPDELWPDDEPARAALFTRRSGLLALAGGLGLSGLGATAFGATPVKPGTTDKKKAVQPAGAAPAPVLPRRSAGRAVIHRPGLPEAVLPVATGSYRLSAGFGEVGSWSRYHTGLDFAAAQGVPVRAVVSGTVVPDQAGSWAGTHVTVRAEDGTHTLYAHLSAALVRNGAVVRAGQQIGRVGTTGRSFGPHLHFEYYPAGVKPGDVYKATNPQSYLQRLSLRA